MQNNPSATAVGTTSGRRWPLFWAGAFVFFLGIVAYIVRFNLAHTETPWYTAILASAGVLLMALSWWQRGGVLRGAGLFLFVMLCGFEWFMLLIAFKTPDYTGPQPDTRLPVFTAALADGKSFTPKNLEDGEDSVLIFYRGHW